MKDLRVCAAVQLLFSEPVLVVLQCRLLGRGLQPHQGGICSVINLDEVCMAALLHNLPLPHHCSTGIQQHTSVSYQHTQYHLLCAIASSMRKLQHRTCCAAVSAGKQGLVSDGVQGRVRYKQAASTFTHDQAKELLKQS